MMRRAMRALSRDGAGQLPRGVWLATGLGLGAVGGFLGGMALEWSGTRAAESAGMPGAAAEERSRARIELPAARGNREMRF